MTATTVQAWVDEIRQQEGEHYALVDAVRELIVKTFPTVSQEVKYGGLLFAADVQFCGVFAYRQHVSVEFSSGAAIADDRGCLEGGGKGRRHLKLRTAADIAGKHLAYYLPLALAAAQQGRSP